MRSWSVFDLSEREDAIARLEKEAAAPGFWDEPSTAQRKMQELGKLQQSVELWKGLRSQLNDLIELTELAVENEDDSLAGELEVEVAEVSTNLARAEMELTLSGPYDDRPAILTIHSGAGGTDSPRLGGDARRNVRWLGYRKRSARAGAEHGLRR